MTSADDSIRVQKHGRVLGPYNREQLAEMLLEGTLAETDAISCNGGRWETIEQFVAGEAGGSPGPVPVAPLLRTQAQIYASRPPSVESPPSANQPARPKGVVIDDPPTSPASLWIFAGVGSAVALTIVLLLVVNLSRRDRPAAVDAAKKEAAEKTERPAPPPVVQAAAPPTPVPEAAAATVKVEACIALICRVIKDSKGVAVYLPLYTAAAIDKRHLLTRGNLWAFDQAVSQLAAGKLDLVALTNRRSTPIRKIEIHPKFPAVQVRTNTVADADMEAFVLYDWARLESTEDLTDVLPMSDDADLESLRAAGSKARILTMQTPPKELPSQFLPTPFFVPAPLVRHTLAPGGIATLVGFEAALGKHSNGSPLVNDAGQMVGMVVLHPDGKGPKLTRILSIDLVRHWPDR